MLTIVCALFAEAQEIIQKFQLKKEIARTHFQMFTDEKQEIRLVITGVGAVAAATAVAEVSTLHVPGKSDLLLNFGTCAAGNDIPIGEVFLCCKITEECSGRTFYPDMLYRHPFAETELVSCVKIKTPAKMQISGSGEIYDMESAAVYQAGNYYYGPQQMQFIKIVSDHGALGHTEIPHSEAVCRYVSDLCGLSTSKGELEKKRILLKQQTKKEAAVLGEQLHCSTVMQRELEQLLWYRKLTGTFDVALPEALRNQGRLPSRDKREGKKILDELKGQLF